MQKALAVVPNTDYAKCIGATHNSKGYQMTKFLPITTDADQRMLVNTAHIVKVRPYTAMEDGGLGYKGPY